MPQRDLTHAITGCLLGHAVGDALGLPREGLSPQRAARIFGAPPIDHALIMRRGMVSDDTEHHAMVAQALLACGGDERRFARSLAWRLRGWFAGLPAGIGLATLRACVRLWVGIPPHRSGVRSAGNGAAMRAPILGVFFADADDARLDAFVRAATQLTHRDPRAEEGARIVAHAARMAARDGAAIEPRQVLDCALAIASAPDLRDALERVAQGIAAGDPPREIASALGLARGVTGFVVHTVPMALACWLTHRADFRAALESVIELGGDTDTTGAIVGALSGAALGSGAIPPRWRGQVIDWPRSIAWLEKLGARLAAAAHAVQQGSWLARPQPLFWPGLVPRNLWFTAVVIGHGLRRLLPPW